MKSLIDFKPRIILSGIYIIRNAINSKVYIGSSSNFAKRYREHFCDLQGNRHHSIYLQRFVNKYGIDKLFFDALEYCKTDLFTREQYYLDLTKCYERKNGFNLSKIAKPNFLAITKKSIEKRNKKIRSAKGSMLGKKHTDEAKKKMSAAQIGNKKCVGRKVSDKVKKIFEEQRKKPVSTETRLKLSKVHKGKKIKPFSEETKLKMSLAKKGKPSPHKGKKFSEQARKNIIEARRKYLESRSQNKKQLTLF